MERNILRNKRGVALIIALIMLLILTFIGISAISTTTFESNIAGNERVGTDAFYVAEAGAQIGLNQIPDTSAIARTPLGNDAQYWSGTPQDKDSPKSLASLGFYQKPGFDTSWAFKRYQVMTTGESSGSMKQIEVQVSYGPMLGNTQYNN